MIRELVKVLAPLFHKHLPAHANSEALNEECMSVCPYEITAAEKFAPEIERLLAAERELMKKRCEWACERVASDPPTEEADGFMEGCNECGDAIRQLDLTAPSSTEEGGDAK